MNPPPVTPSVAADVRWTHRAFADGREIVHHDEPGAQVREARDGRERGARAEAGDLRFDALTGVWVCTAGLLRYLTGSESGAGAQVDDVAPDAIARRPREVAP